MRLNVQCYWDPTTPFHARKLLTHAIDHLSTHHISSARLLLHMSWQVVTRIVDMDKCPVHDGDRFKYVLERLACQVVSFELLAERTETDGEPGSSSPKIMAIFQRRACVQNDVYLHVQLVTRMVRLQALDLPDGLRKAHCQI